MMAIEPVISQRTLFADWTSLVGTASAAIQITRSWLEHVEGTLSDNIVALVGRFSPSKCTLRHDRIYGILGLASDGLSCVVDYSMSFSELLFYLISIYITSLDDMMHFLPCFWSE